MQTVELVYLQTFSKNIKITFSDPWLFVFFQNLSKMYLSFFKLNSMLPRSCGNPGWAPTVKHPLVLLFLSNSILFHFCPRLSSCVRVNFPHLFLCCSTLLPMWDEFNINRWHLINHTLFRLTACVKWHSRCATKKVSGFYQLFVLFVFFMSVCVYFTRGQVFLLPLWCISNPQAGKCVGGGF